MLHARVPNTAFGCSGVVHGHRMPCSVLDGAERRRFSLSFAVVLESVLADGCSNVNRSTIEERGCSPESLWSSYHRPSVSGFGCVHFYGLVEDGS